MNENYPTEGVMFFQTVQTEENKYSFKAQITGPENTIYQGAIFNLDMKLPKDYPFKPPSCQFTTKIYHPNVNVNGNISAGNGCFCACHNDTWSPAKTMAVTLTEIRDLLSNPEPDHPLSPDIAKKYKENRKEYDRIGKEWVLKYADYYG